MGVQIGDILLGLEGELFPEISQDNSGKINAILTPTIGWEADKEFSVTVKREGETLTLSGKVGNPKALTKGLVENPEADADAIKLRQNWLFN